MMLVLCIFASLWSVSLQSSPYIEYLPGTLSIVLSAPHGGLDKPSSIPSRAAGCYISGECVYQHGCGVLSFSSCKVSTVADSNTKDLTMKLRQALYDEFGEYPHVIINNLHRSKMDANRAKDEGTFGDPTAEAAWDDFKAKIIAAKNSISGRGLYFDMHGHSYENRTMLGYMVIKSRLNGDGGKVPLSKYSSVKYGAQLRQAQGVSFETYLRGSKSLGHYLETHGVDQTTVPSPTVPSPGSSKYFSGGWNIKNHGSRYSGQIDAIQIESSYSQRSFSIRPTYAKALGKAIKDFWDEHYQ